MELTALKLAEAALVGGAAGVLGGMAGIGGSLIMLPGLGFFLGYDEPARSVQHLYMASAMVVNVLVSAPATWQHNKKGAVRAELVKYVLPAMAATMVLGVLLSDRVQGRVLIYLLATFIAGYCALNLYRAFKKRPEPASDGARPSPVKLALIGAGTGLIGGLLGIGGGIVMVPLLQVVCRVPLRMAIGTSAAVMTITAIIGSITKLSSLHTHGHTVSEALMLVAVMGPPAVLGGMLGAKLMHRLPLDTVRVVISILLLLAAARLAGLY